MPEQHKASKSTGSEKMQDKLRPCNRKRATCKSHFTIALWEL